MNNIASWWCIALMMSIDCSIAFGKTISISSLFSSISKCARKAVSNERRLIFGVFLMTFVIRHIILSKHLLFDDKSLSSARAVGLDMIWFMRK